MATATSALLVLGAVAGCTGGSEEPGGGAAPAAVGTAQAVERLEDHVRDTPLAPGRYVLSSVDAPSAPMVPVLTVPEGYVATDDASGVAREDVFPAVVWLWDIEAVYSHPCEVGGMPLPVGPSVADLAGALAAQPLRAGTDPVPVTVGGYDGLYVELTVPDDVDVDACPGGRFISWPGRWQQGPGQVDLLWILDVAGQRLTFDLAHDATADRELVAELEAMVTTATFTPAADA